MKSNVDRLLQIGMGAVSGGFKSEAYYVHLGTCSYCGVKLQLNTEAMWDVVHEPHCVICAIRHLNNTQRVQPITRRIETSIGTLIIIGAECVTGKHLTSFSYPANGNCRYCEIDLINPPAKDIKHSAHCLVLTARIMLVHKVEHHDRRLIDFRT